MMIPDPKENPENSTSDDKQDELEEAQKNAAEKREDEGGYQ
ncbi:MULTISPECIES: hypothetical protein [Sphingomonadaceae]|nr:MULTISPECIES: hypothetical protein [Sphingomonadaceae]